MLFLFCSCWLQRQLVDLNWTFPRQQFSFWGLQAKKMPFPLKVRLTHTSPFWSSDSLSVTFSLSVAGQANPERSALQWTKVCYVKEVSSEQRYHLMRRCSTHPLCSSSMSRTAATTKGETSPENTFSAPDLNTHLH